MLGRPTGIGLQPTNLAAPQQSLVADNVVAPIEPKPREHLGDECLQGYRDAGGDHEILRTLGPEHGVHGDDILWRPAPVALDGKVTQRQRLRVPGGDPAGRGGDLLRHKPLRPQRALVVGEDPRAGPQPVEAAVLLDLREGRRLGQRVGIARMSGRRLVDRLATVLAVHRRRSGEKQPRRQLGHPDGLEEIDRGDHDALEGQTRLLERQRDRRLAGEVVDLVGADRLQERDGGGEVVGSERSDHHPSLDAEGGEAVAVARRRIPARPHDAIPLVEEMRGEVSAVLAANAADECRRFRTMDACHA